MNLTSINGHCMQSVHESEFQLIRRLIYNETGIFLKDHKKTMVANRLRKRLDVLGLKTYKKYYDYITKEPAGRRELSEFIACLTTNETFFFRHQVQIKYLIENILPELRNQNKTDRKIRIWSVGCSSGEEPYSIAILMDIKLDKRKLEQIEIVASDINHIMIDQACQGIYSGRALQRMPKYYQTNYFHKDPNEDRFHIVQKIKDRIRFYQHNLLDPFHQGKFDVIFCRNVLIYFNKDSKEKALKNLLQNLRPKGYLIISSAENLIYSKSYFAYVKPTIYRRLEV